MPIPADFNTGTVTGKFVDLLGNPVSGSIKFTPAVSRMVSEGTDTIVIGAAIVAVLDETGSFSVDLPATDDPDINPIDFTYRVTEQFTGGNSYSIDVPVGSTQDLSDVIPVDPSTGNTIIHTGGGGAQGAVVITPDSLTGVVDVKTAYGAGTATVVVDLVSYAGVPLTKVIMPDVSETEGSEFGLLFAKTGWVAGEWEAIDWEVNGTLKSDVDEVALIPPSMTSFMGVAGWAFQCSPYQASGESGLVDSWVLAPWGDWERTGSTSVAATAGEIDVSVAGRVKASVAVILGLAPDVVTIKLPDPSLSPAIAMFLASGVGSPISAAASYSFVCPEAAVILDTLNPAPSGDAFGGAYIAWPVPMGFEVYGWAVLCMNPALPAEPVIPTIETVESYQLGTADQYYPLERHAMTFSAGIADIDDAHLTAWILAPETDCDIAGCAFYVETAGAAGAKARIGLYALNDGGPTGGALIDQEVTVDTTGWKYPTWAGVSVFGGRGYVAVISVDDNTVEIRCPNEPPGVDLGFWENNVRGRLVNSAGWAYADGLPADATTLAMTPATGNRPYLGWKIV